MRIATILFMIYIFGAGWFVSYLDMNCEETVEILKQRITVQQLRNNTQREMIRNMDSIITVQDSLIVSLKIRR